jgi:hypothetical protein
VFFLLKAGGIGAGLGGILFGITVPSRLSASEDILALIIDAMTTANRIVAMEIMVKDCVLIRVQK